MGGNSVLDRESAGHLKARSGGKRRRITLGDRRGGGGMRLAPTRSDQPQGDYHADGDHQSKGDHKDLARKVDTPRGEDR